MSTLARVGFFLALAQSAVAQDSGGSTVAVVLSALAFAGAIAALVVAFRARGMAVNAAEEAGLARARVAQGGGGGLTPEALAAAERVWASRIGALEAQLAAPGGRTVTRAAAPAPASDQAGRLEELERTVSGLSVSVKELRRLPPGPGRERAPESSGGDRIAWPAVLATDTPAIHDVRQALGQALAGGDSSARDLLERLRETDRWPTVKPGSAELAGSLQEISSLLLIALRRGAAREPLDSALFADRVLAVLRPQWKSFQPHLDCRSLLPGTTLDPDWMEDRSAGGVNRPTISEMLSWAVFEKLDSRRRVLAKARVTTD